MNNKKVAAFTAFLIGSMILGLMCISYIFENSWQTTGVVNSFYIDSLEKEKEEQFMAENYLIYYPYINFTNLESVTDKTVLEKYAPEINTYIANKNIDNYREKYKDPVPYMVIYQYVANFCGAAIQNLYGITEHQNSPAMINLIYDENFDETHKAEYHYFLRTDSHSVIDITVDSGTGMITSLYTSQMLVIDADENIKADKKTKFLTDAVETLLINQTKENLEILENHKKVYSFEVKDRHAADGYYMFDVYVWHTDGTKTVLSYNTVNFNYYELYSYTAYYIPVI